MNEQILVNDALIIDTYDKLTRNFIYIFENEEYDSFTYKLIGYAYSHGMRTLYFDKESKFIKYFIETSSEFIADKELFADNIDLRLINDFLSSHDPKTTKIILNTKLVYAQNDFDMLYGLILGYKVRGYNVDLIFENLESDKLIKMSVVDDESNFE